MVQKIYPHHMSQMEKDILREKQNIFYCMNPAVSVVCIPRRMISFWIFAIFPKYLKFLRRGHFST